MTDGLISMANEDAFVRQMQEAVDVQCDEEVLAASSEGSDESPPIGRTQ